MEQSITSKTVNLGLSYAVTWVNRLFIALNAFTASSVVYIYSVRPSKEDNFTETAFGEGAPFYGSPFLEFAVSYPTGIILMLISVFTLWKIIIQKNKTKKFIYNLIFFSALVLSGWTFVFSAVLAMQSL